MDGVLLEQGQQFSINGNLGEFTDQVFNTSFVNSGGTNSFTVTRKIYS